MDFFANSEVAPADGSESRKKHKKKRVKDPNEFRPETFMASASDEIQDPAVNSSGLDGTDEGTEEKSHRKKKSRKEKVAADEEDQDDAQFASQLIGAALSAEMLVEPAEGEEPEKKKRKKRTREGKIDVPVPDAAAEEFQPTEELGKSKKIKRTKVEEGLNSAMQKVGEDGDIRSAAKEENSTPTTTTAATLSAKEDSLEKKKGIAKKKEEDAQKTDRNEKPPPSTGSATGKPGSANSYADPAIMYLRNWKSARAVWSFQKVRQTWLLRNWRDRLKMNEEDFGIFLDYIADLKGGSRTKTADEAKSVREEYENSETYGADDELKKQLYARAGKIVSVLSAEKLVEE